MKIAECRTFPLRKPTRTHDRRNEPGILEGQLVGADSDGIAILVMQSPEVQVLLTIFHLVYDPQF